VLARLTYFRGRLEEMEGKWEENMNKRVMDLKNGASSAVTLSLWHMFRPESSESSEVLQECQSLIGV
jgi:hypothetical protein